MKNFLNSAFNKVALSRLSLVSLALVSGVALTGCESKEPIDLDYQVKCTSGSSGKVILEGAFHNYTAPGGHIGDGIYSGHEWAFYTTEDKAKFSKVSLSPSAECIVRPYESKEHQTKSMQPS